MAIDAGDVAQDVLPDVLRASLRIVLCGSAVGTASAKAGAYYAHQQNKFWKILHETGLTPALRWERSRNDELFPHLYGELDLGAVRRVLNMHARADGGHDILELAP